MAQIVPFRAWRYDPAKVELSRVVTQPYDKISPAMQQSYYAVSPYNLVRIILGQSEPTDSAAANVYTRAATYFDTWRQQGILRHDPEPSIYRYVQRFTKPGSKEALERAGFIALGKIEDYSDNVVFRHEQTLAKPKADRLELLRATRAHFGQLFMLYSDPEATIGRLLNVSVAPDVSVEDEYGVEHQLWMLSDAKLIAQVCSQMNDKKLIIADGHHRYETALNYRDECRTAAPSDTSQVAPYELVMMTFINMDAPGLVILPTHRVVHGLLSFSPDLFREQAQKYFSVDEVDASLNPARAAVILREAGHSGTAMLAVTADRAFLLDTPRALGSSVFGDLSFRQQGLDVVQLHKCLLGAVLGISEEAIREQRNVGYVRDIGEAMEQVRSHGANIAFLMNPARVRQVRDIALAGEVLPQKSTDFYPKLLSGLTIYALDQPDE
jgi:uncharacterized protein (DUF1015 family)